MLLGGCRWSTRMIRVRYRRWRGTATSLPGRRCAQRPSGYSIVCRQTSIWILLHHIPPVYTCSLENNIIYLFTFYVYCTINSLLHENTAYIFVSCALNIFSMLPSTIETFLVKISISNVHSNVVLHNSRIIIIWTLNRRD